MNSELEKGRREAWSVMRLCCSHAWVRSMSQQRVCKATHNLAKCKYDMCPKFEVFRNHEGGKDENV